MSERSDLATLPECSTEPDVRQAADGFFCDFHQKVTFSMLPLLEQLLADSHTQAFSGGTQLG